MDTAAQSAPLRETGWRSYVESLTRVVTALLVLMYGLGFVILSAYEARYGIMQFNPLRTRIVLVGFLFIVLGALPAAALHYKMAYYGPLEPVVENNDPSLQRLKELFLAFGFTYTAFFIAAGFSVFLLVTAPTKVRPLHWWTPLLAVGTYFGVLVVFSFIAKRFRRRPKATTAAAAIAASIFVAGLYYDSEQLATLTVWMFMAGVVVRSIEFDSDRLRSALDFRNWFFAMILVAFYISSVFQLVQPKYGGGAPTPITLFLQKPVAWFNSTTISVSLIDETDQGYYVLSSGKDKALFIPRNDVSSIYYGPVDSPQKQR